MQHALHCIGVCLWEVAAIKSWATDIAVQCIRHHEQQLSLWGQLISITGPCMTQSLSVFPTEHPLRTRTQVRHDCTQVHHEKWFWNLAKSLSVPFVADTPLICHSGPVYTKTVWKRYGKFADSIRSIRSSLDKTIFACLHEDDPGTFNIQRCLRLVRRLGQASSVTRLQNVIGRGLGHCAPQTHRDSTGVSKCIEEHASLPFSSVENFNLIARVALLSVVLNS